MELNEHFFKYDYNEPSSYAFHAIALGFFTKNVLPKRKDKLEGHLFFRLFRLGLLGDALYKSGLKKVESEEHDANHEMLAILFESYLMMSRSVYDYLLFFLRDQYSISQSSYNKFLIKFNEGHYGNIDGKFNEYLRNDSFGELRDLRDSVAHKTANLYVYVKDEEYRVRATSFDNKGVRKIVDESLFHLIFRYTTSLLLLMSYISEKETGKSLSDQLNAVSTEDGPVPSDN